MQVTHKAIIRTLKKKSHRQHLKEPEITLLDSEGPLQGDDKWLVKISPEKKYLKPDVFVLQHAKLNPIE